MTQLNGTHVSLVGNVIRTSIQFENTASTGAFAQTGTSDGGNGGASSIVPQLYASTNVGDRWRVGMAFNVPFGLKTEYDVGWRGQLTALKSEAKSYNLNPSFAYQVNRTLSIGGGIDWQRFTADLTNFAGPLGFAELKASDSAWGFNLGALLNISSGMHVGVAYRSSISYQLNGTANFSSGNGIYNSGLHADLKLPENVAFNILASISKQWEVMASATWTRWSRLQTLTAVRTSASALGATGSVVTAIPFNWRDTVMIAAGANYNLRPDWKLRFGIAHDPSPSNDAARTARLPDQSRLLLTIGAGFKPSWNSGTFDFAYGHEFVKDVNINNTVAGVPGSLIGKFADTADVLSLQYDHKF